MGRTSLRCGGSLVSFDGSLSGNPFRLRRLGAGGCSTVMSFFGVRENCAPTNACNRFSIGSELLRGSFCVRRGVRCTLRAGANISVLVTGGLVGDVAKRRDSICGTVRFGGRGNMIRFGRKFSLASGRGCTLAGFVCRIGSSVRNGCTIRSGVTVRSALLKRLMAMCEGRVMPKFSREFEGTCCGSVEN